MSTAVCSNLLTNLGDVVVFVTAPFITSLRAIYFILCVSGFVPHDDAGDETTKQHTASIRLLFLSTVFFGQVAPFFVIFGWS